MAEGTRFQELRREVFEMVNEWDKKQESSMEDLKSLIMGLSLHNQEMVSVQARHDGKASTKGMNFYLDLDESAVGLFRSGHHGYDDSFAELRSLRQTKSLREYFEEFEVICSRVDVDEDLGFFLDGLSEELQVPVKMFKPKSLEDALSLAKLQEFTMIETRNEPKQPTKSLLYTPTESKPKLEYTSYASKNLLQYHKPPLLPKPSIEYHDDTSKTITQPRINTHDNNPNGWRIFNGDFDIRKRIKTLCFLCEDRHIPGYECRKQKLHVIQVRVENGREFALKEEPPDDIPGKYYHGTQATKLFRHDEEEGRYTCRCNECKTHYEPYAALGNGDVVTEFIEGLVETYPRLQYLNGFPEAKVVLRVDISIEAYDKILAVASGKSGHEPVDVGFVGGLLTAAISGHEPENDGRGVFRSKGEHTNWINEDTWKVNFRHGIFVAGDIAGSDLEHLGFAPGAEFIPYSYVEKESSHIEGFIPELALVTMGGGKEFEDKLGVRPTSGRIVIHMCSQQVLHYRDLPLMINQWANVPRGVMCTKPFVRTLEFLGQKGHMAHGQPREAEEEALQMIEVFTKFVYKQVALLVIVIANRKSKEETIVVAHKTCAIEAMMGIGKNLQAEGSHNLGQNFFRNCGAQFSNESGHRQQGNFSIVGKPSQYASKFNITKITKGDNIHSIPFLDSSKNEVTQNVFRKIKSLFKPNNFIDVESAENEYFPMVLFRFFLCHEKEALYDSDDTTTQLVTKEEVNWQERGAIILYRYCAVIDGYQTGNLTSAMNCSYAINYEAVAIFDVEFQPTPDSFKRTVPHIKDNEYAGLVQIRWSFANKDKNLLTWLQNIKLVSHFEVEQQVREIFINLFGVIGTVDVDYAPRAILDRMLINEIQGCWYSEKHSSSADSTCAYLADSGQPFPEFLGDKEVF